MANLDSDPSGRIVNVYETENRRIYTKLVQVGKGRFDKRIYDLEILSGGFPAYKICKCGVSKLPVIVKLSIPTDTRFIFKNTMFRDVFVCKAETAIVTEIEGNSKKATSFFDETFVYKVGEVITDKNFINTGIYQTSYGINAFFCKDEFTREKESVKNIINRVSTMRLRKKTV